MKQTRKAFISLEIVEKIIVSILKGLTPQISQEQMDTLLQLLVTPSQGTKVLQGNRPILPSDQIQQITKVVKLVALKQLKVKVIVFRRGKVGLLKRLRKIVRRRSRNDLTRKRKPRRVSERNGKGNNF